MTSQHVSQVGQGSKWTYGCLMSNKMDSSITGFLFTKNIDRSSSQSLESLKIYYSLDSWSLCYFKSDIHAYSLRTEPCLRNFWELRYLQNTKKTFGPFVIFCVYSYILAYLHSWNFQK